MAEKTKKCSTKGCRKKAGPDGLCVKHAVKTEEPKAGEIVAPIDGVVRVTELEAAQFSASDAEIRNFMQSQRILELEMAAADRELQDYAMRHRLAQEKRKQQHESLGREIEARKAGYIGFVETLAKKYNVPMKNMTIDPVSRIIRDPREGNQS